MESPKNDLCTLDMKIWYAAFLFFINQDLFSSCNVKGDIEQKEVRECWTNVAVIQGEIVDAMSWPKSAIPPLRRNKAYLVKLKCLKCTNVQMYKCTKGKHLDETRHTSFDCILRNCPGHFLEAIEWTTRMSEDIGEICHMTIVIYVRLHELCELLSVVLIL